MKGPKTARAVSLPIQIAEGVPEILNTLLG